MKKHIASMLFLIAAFAPLRAQASFPVQSQVNVTPQQVTFTVENIWAAPIGCQGQFFARTYSRPYGIWLPFTIGPVTAGEFGYAYMQPPFVLQGDYFIAVPQVNVLCDYLY